MKLKFFCCSAKFKMQLRNAYLRKKSSEKRWRLQTTSVFLTIDAACARNKTAFLLKALFPARKAFVAHARHHFIQFPW